ncbi:MAG: hypothetical protein COB85_01035, partial [Bacteroidetes bacterium]
MPVFVSAGVDNFAIGARSAAMANSSVMLSGAWAAHHNQAGLTKVEYVTGGIYYENRFGIKELGLSAGLVVLPVNFWDGGVFGLSFSYFGYSMYNDMKIGLAYAKKLGDRYSVGIQFDYLRTSIGEDYGNKGTVAVEVGLQAELIDDLNIGVHIFNPTRAKAAEYKVQDVVTTERIPTILRFGLSYTFSEKVILTAEVEKDVYTKPSIKAGIEYQAIKQLYLRGGVSSYPVSRS